MGFIDEKRTISELPIRPRRTKGTYSFKFRNYVASTLLGAGIVVGTVWMFLPTTSPMRESLRKNFFGISDEFKDKKKLMKSFGEQKRSETIEKYIKREQLDEDKGMSGDGGSGFQ